MPDEKKRPLTWYYHWGLNPKYKNDPWLKTAAKIDRIIMGDLKVDPIMNQLEQLGLPKGWNSKTKLGKVMTDWNRQSAKSYRKGFIELRVWLKNKYPKRRMVLGPLGPDDVKMEIIRKYPAKDSNSDESGKNDFEARLEEYDIYWPFWNNAISFYY